MSCYIGFFNVRRGWQSLNTGPQFYLRLIRWTGWLWIYTSRTTDERSFKQKLSVPFLYPGVPAGLTPFRGLVPLGRRNLVPILPLAHPLGGVNVIVKNNNNGNNNNNVLINVGAILYGEILKWGRYWRDDFAVGRFDQGPILHHP
jgi:hypothetical protein